MLRQGTQGFYIGLLMIGIFGMNAHGGKHLFIGRSNGEHLWCLFQRDANRHTAAYIIGFHSRQYLRQTIGKPIKIQMAVRINQTGHGVRPGS